MTATLAFVAGILTAIALILALERCCYAWRAFRRAVRRVRVHYPRPFVVAFLAGCSIHLAILAIAAAIR